MNYSTHRFELDLQKNQSQISISAFQYDTAKKFDIGLTDGGSPYYITDGCLAVLVLNNRLTGTEMVHTCSIVNNSRIVYEFNEATAYELGTLDCQIRIYLDSAEKLAGPKFLLVVAERVGADGVDEDPEFNERYEAIDNILEAEQGRKKAELDRSENENQRVEQEKGRVSAENERTITEEKRVSAESERQKGYAQFDVKIEGKLDKTTEAYKIHGTNGVGKETTFDWGYNATANTIPRRLFDGNIALPLEPTEAKHATPKGYVDGLVNPISEKQTAIEERVEILESLTLSYPQITSTDYEKVVPSDVGEPSRIKMIGGATERVVTGKNILNPRNITLEDSTGGQQPDVIYKVDGTIEYKTYTDATWIWFNIPSPVGRYYILVENGTQNNAELIDAETGYVEIQAIRDYDENDNPITPTTRTLKIMVWQDTSVTTDVYELVKAPEGTVFEPYFEPYFQNAEVERIESLSKNRLPSDVYYASSWKNDSAALDWYKYYLDFLSDGWYCISLKLKEEYSQKVYLYLQKSVDYGASYVSSQAGYIANGTLTNGYLITGNGLENSPFWFKVDKKAGILYRLNFNGITQSKLDQIYDIQIERVNLTQEPSSSYHPERYAPATAYTPYQSEPIATITIPEAVRSKEGYGREGSYITFVDNTATLTVTKDENLAELAEPVITDITALFTEGNKLQVQQGGVIRFVNEHKMPVPNTVAFIKRKE